MPGHPTANPAQFIQGCPVLHVPEVSVMVSYFRDVLGFVSDFGDENYAIVWRDNSAVHFMKSDASSTGIHLFQWIRDVDAYHAEIVARGAVVMAPPSDQPYGVREFSLSAPGNVAVVFAQDLE